MKTLFEVKQLLKQYGAFIYTRDLDADMQLMQMEMEELHRLGLIERVEFQQAMLVLKREQRAAKMGERAND
ncbi:YqgQ family protein [Shouchella clausii]|jgi:uncharacterized protein YqgQ|uniref:DUF910 domain-containing protein n=1 Tax=Shouchella clausii TaxID=79880 RepID=A0A268S4M9_SHOCL|nr:YqgQ family protein [Shouchella clausii]PAD43753.1 hypothetical protein CHH54_05260 [Bacillus sp. 7520-S]SPU21975.1 cytoplasmic protein [Niallia circulans]AST98042.1 hypothetical protein BC8716_19675 [Shouchella clausii]MBU8598742.1 YqgQ family protein [Shouchella clausii]MCM3550554.1 YqgQ family protein [Shouchella clausii]